MSNQGATLPVVIVMGVSGAGKSTVGAALARRLGWMFQDGDDLHPPGNVAKLHVGVALTDADRAPWLAACRAWIDARLAAGEGGVIACSALKRAYREALVGGRPGVRVVYLRVPADALRARLAGRAGHFMSPALLSSQLATLEEPGAGEEAVGVDGEGAVGVVVARVIAGLGLS